MLRRSSFDTILTLFIFYRNREKSVEAFTKAIYYTPLQPGRGTLTWYRSGICQSRQFLWFCFAVMASRIPPVLTIPIQPSGAPPTLSMSQEHISALWVHQFLPKRCCSNASVQLPTALSCLAMGPINPDTSMDWHPSPSPSPGRWLMVWTFGWTWLRFLGLSHSLTGVLWILTLAIGLGRHPN